MVDPLARWTGVILSVGVLFVGVGVLEFPYLRSPCGEPAPPGGTCTPAGLGVSSVTLTALGVALLVVGAYLHSKRGRLRPLFPERRQQRAGTPREGGAGRGGSMRSPPIQGGSSIPERNGAEGPPGGRTVINHLPGRAP